MKKFFLILLFFVCFNFLLATAEEEGDLLSENSPNGHSINFKDVSMPEFIAFVSRVCGVNFIFDAKDLDFKVTFASGKAVKEENILKALLKMLRIRGFVITEEDDYFTIYKSEGFKPQEGGLPQETLAFVSNENAITEDEPPFQRIFDDFAAPSEYQFEVYKLQYHQGAEILDAIKNIAAQLRSQSDVPDGLLQAIQSLQWIKATNSLLCSGRDEVLAVLKKIISSLDVPLKQVFIEVLVIETDVKKGLDFGLEWAASGQYKDRVGLGMSNSSIPSSFTNTMKGINASNTPTGLNQIPVGGGFDLGVIGDIILHKGRSFLSLGSLVSALQLEGDSTIVLNQKIITQDNKNSTIFLGDNIPFTGSVVETTGQGQQLTANIEYRDVGVSLSITPMLGDDDVITLDIDEQISESIDDMSMPSSNTTVNGIRTTKTNMVTHVHVPDKHFLVLSGMIRNTKMHHTAGLPCLGGLPVIGALFSKKRERDEKKNVIVFVRPHIVRSVEDYKKITQNQKDLHRFQSTGDFDKALKLIPEEEGINDDGNKESRD